MNEALGSHYHATPSDVDAIMLSLHSPCSKRFQLAVSVQMKLLKK